MTARRGKQGDQTDVQEQEDQEEIDNIHESPAMRVELALRNDIAEGAYEPGDRLKESVLAHTYATTRSAVREALKSLANENLVTYYLNRGFTVAEITLEDAEDIYQAREVLEGLASSLFARRATDHQRKSLHDAIDEFEVAIKNGGDSAALMRARSSFYDTIYEGCGNIVVYQLLQPLRHRIWFLRKKTLTTEGRPKQTLEELRVILSAIDSQDPQGAEDASRRHIQAAAKVARNILRGMRLSGAAMKA